MRMAAASGISLNDPVIGGFELPVPSGGHVG